MMGCSRTAEVQELLRLGHWPQAAGDGARGACARVPQVRRDGAGDPGVGCGEGELA